MLPGCATETAVELVVALEAIVTGLPVTPEPATATETEDETEDERLI